MVSPRSRSWSSSTGPGRAGLDARRARDLVHLHHPVERAQVDRDHARVLARQARLHPAADAGAAAERDRRVALVAAPCEDGLDLGLGARPGDDVGRVRELAAEAAHDVAVGASPAHGKRASECRPRRSRRGKAAARRAAPAARPPRAARAPRPPRRRSRAAPARAGAFPRAPRGRAGRTRRPSPNACGDQSRDLSERSPEPGKSFIAPLISASCTLGAAE